MMPVLYVTYDGITDPLGQSQVLPYLKGLSLKGHKIFLLSFEKKSRLQDKIFLDKVKGTLADYRIGWKMLIYHKSPSLLATGYDVIRGIICARKLFKHNRITLIHARSYVASLIAVAIKKISGCKFLFDMRGFWPEEKVEAGIWRKDSLVFRLVKRLERIFIQNTDWLVVLTQKAMVIMRERYLCGLNKQIEVIHTCADLNLFRPEAANDDSGEIRMRGAFIFSYAGSLGTWYCIPEVIEFFKIAKTALPDPYFLFLVSQEKDRVNKYMVSSGFMPSEYGVKSLHYEEVPAWLALSRVSVFFIKPVSSKLASCPTKLGESLACGVPVIINPGIGDTDKIVKEEGVGVVIKDFCLADYQNAIDEFKRLIADDDGLRRRCRLTAEKYFSLTSAVEKYNRIYCSLSK